jgi:hypothetical protein
LFEELRDAEGEHPDYVFTFMGQLVKDVKNAFANAKKGAKITDCTLHGSQTDFTVISLTKGLAEVTSRQNSERVPISIVLRVEEDKAVANQLLTTCLKLAPRSLFVQLHGLKADDLFSAGDCYRDSGSLFYALWNELVYKNDIPRKMSGARL